MIQEVDATPSDDGGDGDEDDEEDQDIDAIKVAEGEPGSSGLKQRYPRRLATAATKMSLERVASNMFVLGENSTRGRSQSPRGAQRRNSQSHSLPSLSSQATVGRNSKFRHLTKEDREKLGGIEYRALRLLLKFVVGYFFGLQALGVICLLPWIHSAAPKYKNYLQSQGQDEVSISPNDL